MKVCSLFSGIGGIDLGFQQAGFDIVWANEFDRDAAQTYRHNFGGDHLVERDVKSVRTEDIPDLTVHLTSFNATIAEGEPQRLEHNDIQWITPSKMPNYDFCPADEEILAKICKKS